MALTKLNFPSDTILQVKEIASNHYSLTLSTSYVSTDLRLSITPSSISSKILVIANVNVYDNTQAVHGATTIYRDTSDPGNLQATPSAVDLADSPLGTYSGYGIGTAYVSGTGVSDFNNNVSTSILDQPNTTNPVWYFVSVKTTNASSTYVIKNLVGERSNLTLIELKG
mgnify:FL=1